MSWYRDPQLFIFPLGERYVICRVNKELSVGTTFVIDNVTDRDIYSFSKHFSLGNNKESDYGDFLSYLTRRTFGMINSQGLVASPVINQQYIVSREDPKSPFYSLPGIGPLCVDGQDQQKAEKVQALEKKISQLETINSTLRDKEEKLIVEVSELQEKLNREKNDKQALEKKISKLTSKLEESCGVGGGSEDKEPWMTGHSVPSSWVPFEELDVQTFRKDNHLTITNVGIPKFAKDNTTNVQTNHFYRGVFPIVVVNVAELIPNKEDARFDPDIWSLCINGGISYAARKPITSEMFADVHMTS